MKPGKNQRNKEYNFGILKPALSKAYGKIIMISRMMHNMSRPEKTAIMRNAVCPVRTKIIEYETWNETPPVKFHSIGQYIINANYSIEQTGFH